MASLHPKRTMKGDNTPTLLDIMTSASAECLPTRREMAWGQLATMPPPWILYSEIAGCLSYELFFCQNAYKTPSPLPTARQHWISFHLQGKWHNVFWATLGIRNWFNFLLIPMWTPQGQIWFLIRGEVREGWYILCIIISKRWGFWLEVLSANV